MKLFRLFVALLVLFILTPAAAEAKSLTEIARWEAQARRITITRDDWGIAHVHGRTDSDAVFGALYAQAEDDFPRIEANYLRTLGRTAEAEGEAKLYQDLRQKLFMDPDVLKAQYAASPPWLRDLMTAFADGVNYYLYRHPEVKPRVIKRFEPWMALSFSEGSIGGALERISIVQLEDFYSKSPSLAASKTQPFVLADIDPYAEPTGSNGMAIAPSNTADHHALLLINPHTSFYFRSEIQMTSDQGLNAYGAVTWGQFFIYQGFNERAGWAHTTSGVDTEDEYLETVERRGSGFVYRYGGGVRPVLESRITVPYTTPHGMESRTFTVYRTHHGPVIRATGGKWVAIRLMQRPVLALTQSYVRTKAHDYRTFRQSMELKSNSSNNTIFADADGDIAYFHGNFVPRRDTRFDWTKPVDGSDPATEWKGLLSIDETPHLLNPKSGWLYNANNWPWSAAGPSSPRRSDYPAYVENGGESARGRHAIRLLQDKRDFTPSSLIAAAYDSYLPWFETPLAVLFRAWEQAPASDPIKAKTADEIAVLRGWDRRWAVSSIPTSLAIFWGDDLRRRVADEAKAAHFSVEDYVAQRTKPQELLHALAAASDRLTADFGTWRVPWGQINRFQRTSGDLVQTYSDAEPSIPVGFTSAMWGSLASFGAHAYPGTHRWYGNSGNSFVAVVEFGPKVRAKAVMTGGASGHMASRHFDDQATRYAAGALRDVYFYPEDLKGHTERVYHPGE